MCLENQPFHRQIFYTAMPAFSKGLRHHPPHSQFALLFVEVQTGWMDGRTDGQTDECMNGWMDGWIRWPSVCCRDGEVGSVFSPCRFETGCLRLEAKHRKLSCQIFSLLFQRALRAFLFFISAVFNAAAITTAAASANRFLSGPRLSPRPLFR